MVALLLPAVQQARESARSTSKQQDEKTNPGDGILVFEFEDGARDAQTYTTPQPEAPEPAQEVMLTELILDAGGQAESWVADDFGI